MLVSFTLALWVALRSRGVHLGSAWSLVPLLRRRLINHPMEFFLPVEQNKKGSAPTAIIGITITLLVLCAAFLAFAVMP